MSTDTIKKYLLLPTFFSFSLPTENVNLGYVFLDFTSYSLPRECTGKTTNLYDVMHQAVSKHPVQFELFVFQNVLKTSFWTVFCQQTCMRWVNAGSQKADKVVVMKVAHLWKKVNVITNCKDP